LNDPLLATQASIPTSSLPARAHRTWFERRLRLLPIRWRILAIAVLNSALALILLLLVWDGAKVLSGAWNDLRQVRQSERLLVALDSEAGRLQSLIHRYFNQPEPSVLAEIIRRRESLISNLRAQASFDTLVAGTAQKLIGLTERFVGGFDELRHTRSAISRIYETEVLRPAKDMASLYAVLDGSTQRSDSLILPPLARAREAYNAMLLAANAYYLSNAQEAEEEAKRQLDVIEASAPTMLDFADNDIQRSAVSDLRRRAVALRGGLDRLAEQFGKQARLLRESIDDMAAAMSASIDELTATMRQRERSAQERFDRAVEDVSGKVAVVAFGFVLLVILMGIMISRSINEPLGDLRQAMNAIVTGDYDRRVSGLRAPDEIGDMARAIEVFRENAIARRQAEEAVRASKEEAEAALSNLRDTQTSLIEAEKLAALGSLVAGVAHEVNNPVGISLTVASSLARRCQEFAAEIEAGPVRRSRLTEFVDGNREAANQLVANLHRAGELIQSFKQVAVDRTHADRRQFDLKESTEQIIASLKPGLRHSQLRLVLDIPPGIVMNGYPGPFGQLLTNLFLNSVNHAFPGDTAGTISIVARTSGADQVHMIFRDDGIGMPDDVQRKAFDPFFTTRRGEGGTGLGLHIVYNLVTRKLGGRIVLSSRPGEGTTFRINLPRVAPIEAGEPDSAVTGRVEHGVG
jgi:signal transduction histidine kinase